MVVALGQEIAQGLHRQVPRLHARLRHHRGDPVCRAAAIRLCTIEPPRNRTMSIEYGLLHEQVATNTAIPLPPTMERQRSPATARSPGAEPRDAASAMQERQEPDERAEGQVVADPRADPEQPPQQRGAVMLEAVVAVGPERGQPEVGRRQPGPLHVRLDEGEVRHLVLAVVDVRECVPPERGSRRSRRRTAPPAPSSGGSHPGRARSARSRAPR